MGLHSMLKLSIKHFNLRFIKLQHSLLGSGHSCGTIVKMALGNFFFLLFSKSNFFYHTTLKQTFFFLVAHSNFLSFFNQKQKFFLHHWPKANFFFLQIIRSKLFFFQFFWPPPHKYQMAAPLEGSDVHIKFTALCPSIQVSFRHQNVSEGYLVNVLLMKKNDCRVFLHPKACCVHKGNGCDVCQRWEFLPNTDFSSLGKNPKWKD